MEQCVRESGFPYFLKSLSGNYLPDVEEALIAIEASGAQDVYVRSVEAALSDNDGYQKYLIDGPNPGSSFYDKAMEAILEYLTKGISIYDTNSSQIQNLFPYVEKWLNDNCA